MNTKIKLSKEYTVANKVFDTITLREPTYADVFMSELGKPFEFQPGRNGAFLATYPDVVDAYMQRLIVEPGYEYISRLSVEDSLALERHLRDFFLTSKASESAPTPSFSSSDGSPAMSSD